MVNKNETKRKQQQRKKRGGGEKNSTKKLENGQGNHWVGCAIYVFATILYIPWWRWWYGQMRFVKVPNKHECAHQLDRNGIERDENGANFFAQQNAS